MLKKFKSNIKNLAVSNIYKNVMAKYLSLGEIRRLELCRLVIEQKKLWILDEPYLGLDESITRILTETLKSHINNGGMIIFSSYFHPQIMDIEELQLEDYENN